MTTLALQPHSIMWGDIQLTGVVDPDAPYSIAAMSTGTNFGNPVPLVDVLQSLAIDGALVVRTGWDQRQIVVRIRVRASDGASHAQVEALLNAYALMESPPAITWTSPLIDSEPAVFDVLQVRYDGDTDDGWDSSEIQSGDRFWLLTMACLPFARSEAIVDIPALPPAAGAPTVTTIDDCTATTNWTRTSTVPSPTGPTVTGGGLRVGGGSIVGGTYMLGLRRTAATSTTLPYLVLDVATVNLPSPTIGVKIDGVAATILATVTGTGESGSNQIYVAAPSGGSFTTLDVTATFTTGIVSGYSLTVYKVAQTDTIAVPSSTTRQQSRLATIYGSMPTRATLKLYDASPAQLGENILIYTCSNTAWTPPLRRLLTSGGGTITNDSAMVSGKRNTLAAGMVFNLPANTLAEAAYALLARIKCTTPGVLTWSATMVNGTPAATVGSDVTVSGSVNIPDTTAMTSSGYQVLDLADRLQLPPVLTEDDTYIVQLSITGTANMTFDEGWLFDLDNGRLTWVQDPGVGSGRPMEWIEVRSPELGSARPTVWAGTGALGAGAVCIDSYCKSFGAHRFNPGPMLVQTITTTSLLSQCELEYYPRWHTHPQRLDDAA